MKNKTLISIVGPTAIGKTRISIEIAKALNTEIISCDSRQFFKEMKIGTAVPETEELNAVKHHFIQHISIFDEYNVGKFEIDAIDRIEKLFQNKDVLCLTGGSGLYQKAVLEGLNDFPKVDSQIRRKLNQLYETEGIEALQKKLSSLDPEYYSRVDQENPHRLIRALEICIGTGKTFSFYLRQKTINRGFNSLKIGLTADREIIYQRIEKRVDNMFKEGLIDEAKKLLPYEGLNALNTVGYKELFQYFENKLSLEEAKAEIKKNTRRFAKRQLTWYRKETDINWFQYDTDVQKIIGYIKKSIHHQ